MELLPVLWRGVEMKIIKCDRCGKEVPEDQEGDHYEFLADPSSDFDVCNNCDDLLTSFLAGEAIPEIEKDRV